MFRYRGADGKKLFPSAQRCCAMGCEYMRSDGKNEKYSKQLPLDIIDLD
jgi:hypothetical protein